MEKLGVDRKQLDLEHRAPKANEDDETVPLAPHLLPVVKLFSRLRTQWNAIADSGVLLFVGLKYESVDFVMEKTGFHPINQERTFDQLRTMEIAALQVLNEPRKG